MCENVNTATTVIGFYVLQINPVQLLLKVECIRIKPDWVKKACISGVPWRNIVWYIPISGNTTCFLLIITTTKRSCTWIISQLILYPLCTNNLSISSSYSLLLLVLAKLWQNPFLVDMDTRSLIGERTRLFSPLVILIPIHKDNMA